MTRSCLVQSVIACSISISCKGSGTVYSNHWYNYQYCGDEYKLIMNTTVSLVTVQINLKFTHVCRQLCTRVLACLTHGKLQKLANVAIQVICSYRVRYVCSYVVISLWIVTYIVIASYVATHSDCFNATM